MRAIEKFENVIGNVQEMAGNYFDETIPLTDMEFESLESAMTAREGLKSEMMRYPQGTHLFCDRIIFFF